MPPLLTTPSATPSPLYLQGVSQEDGHGRPDLARVHERYGAWIRARARQFLGPDGDDAAQEVWLRLGPALDRLRSSSEEVVRALVSKTIRSVCIDAIRRRVRSPPASDANMEAIVARAPPADAGAEERKRGRS